MQPAYVQLPLVLLGGILGSSHCIGMCGGFALAVGYGSASVSENVIRQLTWSLGRIFTYTFCGAVCGYLGARLTGESALASAQGTLAVLAGVLLVVQGAVATGAFRRRRTNHAGCSITRFSWLLPIVGLLSPCTSGDQSGSRATETFLAGVVTGFLPCGLVYAYLALAAASGQFWHGMIIMTTFGLGTVPVMVATGAGASVLSHAARARLFRIAAACVLITGVLTIGRGVAALRASDEAKPQSCPMCAEHPQLPGIASD